MVLAFRNRKVIRHTAVFHNPATTFAMNQTAMQSEKFQFVNKINFPRSRIKTCDTLAEVHTSVLGKLNIPLSLANLRDDRSV